MERASLHARFDLTEREAQLADFLRKLYDAVTRDAADEEPYNSHFASEEGARFAWGLNNVGRGSHRLFPGDKPEPRRRRARGNTKFQRVKNAVRIEELAGRFTELRVISAGKMKGLCPVHDEKTPSFHVNLERQAWICFGACARGGDVIDLARELMDRGKL